MYEMMVWKTNAFFPSQFVLMSMELITCHVTNRLVLFAGTYFFGVFLKLSLKMQSGTGTKKLYLMNNFYYFHLKIQRTH